MKVLSDLDLYHIAQLSAYRINGSEIVDGDGVSAESFIKAIEDFCSSSLFPIYSVAIGLTSSCEPVAGGRFINRGIAAEMFIVEPFVNQNTMFNRLLKDLSADEEWLTTVGGLLLTSHRLKCKGATNCSGCREAYIAKKEDHRRIRREGNWDRIVHVDFNKSDFARVDITNPASVKEAFLEKNTNIQSRADLRNCVHRSSEHDEGVPASVTLEALLDNIPLDKFVMTLHLFGFDTCAHEECTCYAGSIRADYITFYRGVVCSETRSKDGFELKSTSQVCGNCQKKSTTTPFRACSNCRTMRYCDRDCQVAHWPTHKNECNDSQLVKSK
jgi:hypothetical protein